MLVTLGSHLLPPSQNDRPNPPPKVLYTKMFAGQTFCDTKLRGIGQSYWDGGSKIFPSFATTYGVVVQKLQPKSSCGILRCYSQGPRE